MLPAIEARLGETRRRLLDLTRRNRLLNHKPGATGTLRIVDEVPDEVYRTLVGEGKVMQFLAHEEAPDEIRSALAPEDGDAPGPLVPPGDAANADRETPAAPEAAGAPTADQPREHTFSLPPIESGTARSDRHTDRRLQTALEGDKLQTRLLYLAREAASALEEQGYNILFLTVGVVEWQDADPSGPRSRAPLVFAPVELQRASVHSRHSVRAVEDDVVTNPCLVELCKRQFDLDLPLWDPDGGSGLAAYFRQVAEALEPLAAWRVLPSEIHVGLFSFAKLLMYQDLDPAKWPEHRRITDHPLVRQLSGIDDGAADSPDVEMPDPSTLDDTVRPTDSFQVLDADSSQQAAILAAKRGMSAVIEGPPGTGKSQTIANIIAECMSEGRTVLFVAEKSAALDVVKRRLERVGLGDFVLELHSRKASKKAVLDELQRTLGADAATRAVREADAHELEAVRTRLNLYVRELHAPVEPLSLSPFDVISRAATLAREPEARCSLPDALAWAPEQLRAAIDGIESLDRRLERVGDPETHPWRGAGLTSAGLEVRQRVREWAERLDQDLTTLTEESVRLANRLSATPPETPGEIEKLLADATVLATAPQVTAASVADARWNSLSPGLTGWLEGGAERQRQRAIWSRWAREDAEKADWREVLERRRRQKDSFLRFLTPSWYRDGRRLRASLVDGARPSAEEQVACLAALVRSAALRDEIERGGATYADMFGPSWRGVDGDWDHLGHFAESVVRIRQLILRRAVGTEAAQRTVEAPARADLSQAIERVRGALDGASRAREELLAALSSDDLDWFGCAWDRVNLLEADKRMARLPGEVERLQDWAGFRSALVECRATPAAPFVEWALGAEGLAARGRLASAFARHFYRLWVDRALEERPALRHFRGDDHEALIERFRQLDKQWIEMSRQRLANLVIARRPDVTRTANRQSKLGILRAEIRKQRNLMPLRKLFAVAGDVIQSIKPCFMMSPISVAQYLAPGSMDFDLVIFDEASQVEPADGYGAIARGRQLLLVGDEKQLPPTNFFSRVEADERTSGDGGDLALADLESILALGAVRLPSRCTLRWHYRSQHASLIDFSNQKFYDGALRVFPSPHTGREEYGLRFRFVEGGVYMRGAGQYNPVEARAVADEVVRHALATPNLSLGVGAFSHAQQRAIQDEIEQLRRESSDERLERFFADHPHEPFFVKNLETIQGDERDVILLSVGYGRDANGRMTMNFGPLNREGGWRRLNVLVTRARRRCLLFSTFRADDMNMGGTHARGVVALKEYLHYAEHGRLADAGVSTGEHDSPFEGEVCRALREHGWEVHAQVGAAGFSIDLAVVDPDRPGRYLLGVECDGATYHGSATARDRDRLRQAVLEGLGWRIHRIWSTDWFQRPEPILARLLARLEALPRGGPDPRASEPPPIGVAETDLAENDPPAGRPVPEARAASADNGVGPYHRDPARSLGDQSALLAMPAHTLAGVIAGVVRAESPIHVEEATRVIAGYFSTRASTRSREAFRRGLAAAVAQGLVAERGEFLWHGGPDEIRVRSRGDDCPVTRTDLIAPEEFQAAVRLVLRNEFGLRREALVTSVARLMGFGRAGQGLVPCIDAAIDRLLLEEAIAEDGHGFLVLK